MKIDLAMLEKLDRMAAAGAPARAIIECLRIDFERDEAKKQVKRPRDAKRKRERRRATKSDKPMTPSDTERHEATVDDWPDNFGDRFWQAYPRKTEKLAAMKKLAVLHSSKMVTFADLMDGVQRYAASVKSTEMQFVKHPAAWLNAGRWSDEAASLKRSTGPPRKGPQGFETLFQPEVPRDHPDNPEYDIDLTANRTA